jgi:hypothetical protein
METREKIISILNSPGGGASCERIGQLIDHTESEVEDLMRKAKIEPTIRMDGRVRLSYVGSRDGVAFINWYFDRLDRQHAEWVKKDNERRDRQNEYMDRHLQRDMERSLAAAEAKRKQEEALARLADGK